jgi:hypothetical protein
MENIFYFLNHVLRITAYQFSILVLVVNFTFLVDCLFLPYVRWFSFLTYDLNCKRLYIACFCLLIPVLFVKCFCNECITRTVKN